MTLRALWAVGIASLALGAFALLGFAAEEVVALALESEGLFARGGARGVRGGTGLLALAHHEFDLFCKLVGA